MHETITVSARWILSFHFKNFVVQPSIRDNVYNDVFTSSRSRDSLTSESSRARECVYDPSCILHRADIFPFLLAGRESELRMM